MTEGTSMNYSPPISPVLVLKKKKEDRNLSIILKHLFSPASPSPQLSLTTTIHSIIFLQIIKLLNFSSGKTDLRFLGTSL